MATRPLYERVNPWWGPARVPFLLLTPACMAMAVSWCWWQARLQGGAFDGVSALLAVLGALAAHLGVNALNEHHDFRSGLDARAQRTPFSGGSGVLPARPDLAPVALVMGVGALGLTALIGLYFLWRQPDLWWRLAPLGAMGLVLVVTYTPWVTRQPWLCLVAPGLGFGPLMGLGTMAVLLPGPWQAADLAWTWLPFCLVNNLLLLNQFPDVAADRAVGRRTLPMVLGRPAATRVLGLQYVAAYAGLLAGVLWQLWPAASLLGLLTAPMAARAWWVAREQADRVEGLLPAMGLNVGVSLLTPVLAAVGLFLAG